MLARWLCALKDAMRLPLYLRSSCWAMSSLLAVLNPTDRLMRRSSFFREGELGQVELHVEGLAVVPARPLEAREDTRSHSCGCRGDRSTMHSLKRCTVIACYHETGNIERRSKMAALYAAILNALLRFGWWDWVAPATTPPPATPPPLSPPLSQQILG